MNSYSWAWVRVRIAPAPIVVENASAAAVLLLDAPTRELAMLADAGSAEAMAALWMRASVSHAA